MFEGLSGGGLYVAMAAKAGEGVVVAVCVVKALSLRAGWRKGEAGVAVSMAGEEVGVGQGFEPVFAKSYAGITPVAGFADVFHYGMQFAAAQAVFIKQQEDSPAAARCIPDLLAFLGGKSRFAGGAGLAVDAVVRLAVRAAQRDRVTVACVFVFCGKVGIAFCLLLPVAAGCLQGVFGQPDALFQGFAVVFFVCRPVGGWQGGQGKMVFREGVAGYQEGLAVRVALQALLQLRLSVLFGNPPADLPEEGIADQGRAEGGVRFDEEFERLHGVIRQTGGCWRSLR